ncbi:glycosyltransferase [Aromatoleum toluolicum]|uniref:Glycosyltransferase n=1 Tax=Aromatoleum toluolicum TaxID=90060 RepID=A0ABX1NKX5_9RHOO|nr:glycosyltransferase [Aromatoleum toluolicum]NMF99891.1 glycosyltransferase [Aromatoleum toluolicum]
MSAPTCSICIANYNGESLLADCIDSILAQDCDFAFEILVHDDASTDASLAVLHARYPQVEVITSTTNVGFCIANNRLADRARGDYLLLLNNDAALAPDALSTLFAHARRQQPPGILTLPQYDWETNVLVDRGCLLDPFYNPVPNLAPDRTDVAMVIGACLWIPRKLWHELGGFPEWFESIAEDMYLCCRARLAGYPVEVTAGSAYRHRQGQSFGGNRASGGKLASTYRRRRLSERNKTFVLAICTPGPWMWLLLPLHLLTLATEGIVLALARRELRIWREIYANVYRTLASTYSQLLLERQAVQSKRKIGSISYLRGFLPYSRKLQLAVRHGLPGLR